MTTAGLDPAAGRIGLHGERRRSRRGAATLLLVAVGAVVIIFLRRPDALLHPQFYAEDGADYFANAYDRGGLANLLHQHGGYLTVYDRLAGLIAAHLPLAWAPACFAAAGAAAQALPALILVSERSSVLISSRWLRLLAAGLYLALPNTAEIDVNLDNAQWHLAMAAFLLIVTRPRPGRRTVAFDGVVVLLCGLTGPFGLVLPLVAGPIAAVRRARREVLLFGVSVVTAVSQAICLLDTTRQKSTLGATVHLGIQILGGKVVLGPVLGQRGYSDLLSRTSSQVPFILAAVAGLVFVVLVLLWGTAELRLLLVASGLVLFGSLLDPVVGDQAWRALAAPTTGGRYYFVPVALGVTILIAMLERLPRPMAALGAVYLVAVAFVGVPLDFRYPAFQSFHWARYARAFDRDPPGTVVDIPIPPTGWQVRLIRR